MSAAPPSLTAPATSAQPEQQLKDELFWGYAALCWPIHDVLERKLGLLIYRRSMTKDTAEALAEDARRRAHEILDDRIDEFLTYLRNGRYGPGKLTLLKTPPA